MNKITKSLFSLVLPWMLACSPKVSPEIPEWFHQADKREKVWPYQYRNESDTTEYLEFRGVNLFYYNKGNPRSMFGTEKALGHYAFKGDTLLLIRLSDYQLYSHSKFDPSYIIQKFINDRNEYKNHTLAEEEEIRMAKKLDEEFEADWGDIPNQEHYEGWSSVHDYFREAPVEEFVWRLKGKNKLLKINPEKGTTETFKKEKE